jgi:hypothetical protein
MKSIAGGENSVTVVAREAAARDYSECSSRSQRTSRADWEQLSADLVEVGQRKHGLRSRQVLGQTAVSHFGETPQLLDYAKGVFAARPGPRARPVDHPPALAIDSRELITLLERHWRFVVPDDLGFLSDEVERFVFAGYPIGRCLPSDSQPSLGMLTDFAPRYRKKSFNEINRESHSETVPLNPAIDILLEYPDSFVGADGKEINALDVRGISGSPLWAVRPDPAHLLLDSPQQRLQLVGVVTAIIEGDYIRSKRWTLIAEAFREIDAYAAQELLRCLSASGL